MNYDITHLEGEGGFAKRWHYYITISLHLVKWVTRREGGVKNLKKIVNVIYEWPTTHFFFATIFLIYKVEIPLGQQVIWCWVSSFSTKSHFCLHIICIILLLKSDPFFPIIQYFESIFTIFKIHYIILLYVLSMH